MGDFNRHIDSSSSNCSYRQLTGTLESFDLHHYVDFPTHIHSHSLKLMICSTRRNVLSISTSDLISDHFSVVDLRIPSNHSRIVPQTINNRKLQAISNEAFKANIKYSELMRHPKTNASGLTQQYDKCPPHSHRSSSPLGTRKISPKPPNPWMTPAILASKRHYIYLECV